MADNPDIQWALKLLEPYEETHPLYKYGTYIVTFASGFGFGAFSNFMRMRPLMSGIQMHFLFGALFMGGIGLPYNKYTYARAAEKAEVTRNYIIKHPEDFIQAPQVKIADTLDPWLPIR